MKKKLLISFSGGRTSAYMLWWLLNEWEFRNDYEIVVVFANTGIEDTNTLLFVHRCAKFFNIEVIWVEAKHRDENGNPFSEKGWAVRHQVVDYYSAARCQKKVDGTWNWTPFEELISVLGIPSTNAPFCSYQLKRYAIESLLESMGWTDYYKAIGIRYDERLKRISKGWKKNKILYPLIFDNPQNKKSINKWWSEQPFDLGTHKDLGNCTNCWKKDMKTLARNARNYPQTFEWWSDMQTKYGYLMPRENVKLTPPFNFYRGNMTVQDIFDKSKLEDTQLDLFMRKENLSPCSESCEAF